MSSNIKFQFFHMRRTHSGHCVGEIYGGLTALVNFMGLT